MSQSHSRTDGAPSSHGFIEPIGDENLVAEYRRTFLEWRLIYGMADPCMLELHAAILAECERPALTLLLRKRLRALADWILSEQRAHAGRAA